MSKLKNLYTQLIESELWWLESRHDEYKKFDSQIKQIRDRINAGEGDLSHDKDYDFLKKLLLAQDNGVASSGQSILKEANFESFIKNEKFISSLQKFILEPNKKYFKEFNEAWLAQGKGNNPVRINRVAAVCTHKVSMTVTEKNFNQVFKWLIKEEIIEKYPKEEEQDWFSKNLWLLEIIKKEFEAELRDKKTNEFYLRQFVWILCKNVSNPSSSPKKQTVKHVSQAGNHFNSSSFNLKKQIVKYGPPGTGKTYQAKEDTRAKFNSWQIKFDLNDNFSYEDQYELVQFHPSFSYEDFIEGLRPVLDKEKKAQLTLQNGIFKEFCKKAGKWEIDIYKLDKKLDWESLTIKELRNYKDEGELSGSHWKYIWEVLLESEALLESKVMDVIPPFFFIIDEINRAELSRVFGELMYCLEYRGAKEGMIKTQYANLNNKKTGMLKTDKGYSFFIPTNIYLIGTMNTIDRSVESFDIALRRRFIWQEVMPDIEVLRDHLKEGENPEWVTLADNLKRLNDQITKEPLLGRDYQIGHAYLMNMNYAKDLKVEELRKKIWEDSILPLLQEYLRGSGTNKEAELISSLKTEFGILKT